MSLLSDIFQQNQQIANNPASVVRTPQQQAYDNLLNRQYDIEQQNKRYNTFNGLMQGAGGLGKILASTFVKDPMQQYGAMQGLGEQETRTDNLRQAYNLARNAQNKDYVQQAKEQLDLANADDERKYNRELTANQIAYKKAMDLLEQQNKDRQFEFAKEQAEIDNQNKADILKLQKDKLNAEIDALKNKPAELTPEQKLQQKIEEENAIAKAKAKREAQQDLSRAISGQKAFEGNIAHLKDLSKNTGTILDRSIGGIASLFSGKDNSLTKANNSMSELVAQLRQAALNASGISGESDDKAQQAKINDIYKRVGLTDKTKSLTQAEVNGIINNIQNLYKQRVAEKQNLLDSFIDNNSITWE